MELERPHGTNWSGLKLTEEKNGVERVRRGERERGRSVPGLRNSETTQVRLYYDLTGLGTPLQRTFPNTNTSF